MKNFKLVLFSEKEKQDLLKGCYLDYHAGDCIIDVCTSKDIGDCVAIDICNIDSKGSECTYEDVCATDSSFGECSPSDNCVSDNTIGDCGYGDYCGSDSSQGDCNRDYCDSDNSQGVCSIADICAIDH